MVEEVGRVEPRGVRHADFGAKTAVAEVRPVADFAVADAHNVAQAVARHVGEVDGLRAVSEDDARSVLFVESLHDALRGTEASLSKRLVPNEDVTLADQEISVTVARQVDEFQVGVVEREIGQRSERLERRPAKVCGALEVAGCAAAELHHIQLAIAGQVEQLLAALQVGWIGQRRQRLERTETRLVTCFPGRAIGAGGAEQGADVALVKPSACLLGEDAREAFAIEISPLVLAAVEPDGQVLEALRVDLANFVLNQGLAVGEIERRQGP